jgi:hypothetical protein
MGRVDQGDQTGRLVTLRKQRTLTFKPHGVTDAVDGTNSLPGALKSAINLVPSMHTKNVWVPRPAITKSFDFSALDPAPGQGEALIEIGDRVWGMIQSSTFPGKSVPFCYDYTIPGFVTIQGLTAGNLPNSTANSGDWIPPILTQVGAYLIFTHPGFALPNAFGWIDMTGLTDTATATTTSGSAALTALSKNTLLAGWRPGMQITGAGIPVGTRITAVSTDGLTVTISQAATATATGVALSLAGGTPASPLWAAGNANAYPLPAVVRTVAMFNGRAWYGVANAAAFSDAGDPLQRTNANQVLTLQNSLAITAMATQPFANQTVIGGVVQALLLFQGNVAIWQVIGDQATNNLTLNLVTSIGTDAPLSIVGVPPALRFIAPDGMRQINLDGTVSPPLGANGDGVALPFINATYPSRIAAAYNEDVYRVSLSGNVSAGGAITPNLVAGEYFYHEKLQAWSGPHTSPAKLVTETNRPAINHGFLVFPLQIGNLANTPTAIYFSNTRPLIDSTYQEAGAPLNWVLQTCLLPDSGDMFENSMVETSAALALAQSGTASVVFRDERTVPLDAVAVTGFAPPAGSGAAGNQWNQMAWNEGLWGTILGAILMQRQLDWHVSLVFKQGSLVISGLADANTAVGNLYLRYQRTGYMLIDPARLSTGLPGITNFAA